MSGPGPHAPLDADAVADLLGLRPLQGEGGRFRNTHLDAHGTAIYVLYGPDDASALHRLTGVEVWHHYAGAPLRLLTLDPDGEATEHHLGDDLVAGQRPQVVVPGGVWQGATSAGDWTLAGTTMAPPYDPAAFTLGDPVALRHAFPQAPPLLELVAERSEDVWRSSGHRAPPVV